MASREWDEGGQSYRLVFPNGDMMYPQAFRPDEDVAQAVQVLEALASEARPRESRFNASVGVTGRRFYCELERSVYAGEPDTFFAEADKVGNVAAVIITAVVKSMGWEEAP